MIFYEHAIVVPRHQHRLGSHNVQVQGSSHSRDNKNRLRCARQQQHQAEQATTRLSKQPQQAMTIYWAKNKHNDWAVLWHKK